MGRGEHLRAYFTIPEDEVFPLAERFFLKAAGFDLENGKHRRMYEEAQRVRADGLARIRVEGFTDVYGAEAYDGAAVAAGGRRIPATAFGQIPRSAVRQVIFYVITAGECGAADDADIMTQLYAHLWGTAYVDAGRILLENRDNAAIVDLLGAGEIGVRCVDSGAMLPIKTCSGVFLVTDGSVAFPGDECLVCIGNKTGCAECMVGNRRSLDV